MSESDFGYLRSGAYNDGLDGGEEERYRNAELYGDSPLPAGLAERIADSVLSEPPVVSQDGGDGWNLARDTARLKDGEAKGPGRRGLRQGYGDEAARAGYNARTGS
jgi:hypothetical protein